MQNHFCDESKQHVGHSTCKKHLQEVKQKVVQHGNMSKPTSLQKLFHCLCLFLAESLGSPKYLDARSPTWHYWNISVSTSLYWKCITEIFQWLRVCTETTPLKYFSCYMRVLKQHHWNISFRTCVYWKWTTEIFQWVRACTESAPPKYFRGYVLVLKQHHQNISVATRVYWNCYTEIFLGLRACTETAVLKYSVSTRVYWNCIALLKFFSVYPCVLQLHYSNISVWTCQYWNISMPTTIY